MYIASSTTVGMASSAPVGTLVVDIPQAPLGTGAVCTVRFAQHRATARRSLRQEYQDSIPPHMRLVVFGVSAFGALGPPAVRFLAALQRRVGNSVPGPLLDQASWAVPRFAPFARMAATFAVRRGLADYVRSFWVRRPATAGQPD